MAHIANKEIQNREAVAYILRTEEAKRIHFVWMTVIIKKALWCIVFSNK